MPSKEQTKVNPTHKGATFVAPGGWRELDPKGQIHVLRVWCAANPDACIQAVEGAIPEGGLPIFLRAHTGRRASIWMLLAAGAMSITKYLIEARKYGGGWTDILAGVNGGYSRNAAGYGTSVLRLFTVKSGVNI